MISQADNVRVLYSKQNSLPHRTVLHTMHREKSQLTRTMRRNLMHERPQNFIQGGSKVILIVKKGGSKSKNFPVWVGQNPKFSPFVRLKIRKFAKPGGSSDPV